MKKHGPMPGLLPKATFDLLLEAYQTYIMLAQINGDGDLTKNKNLLEVVNTVAGPTRAGPMGRRLLEQLQKRSPEIKACFQTDIEQKRAKWTTYNKSEDLV